MRIKGKEWKTFRCCGTRKLFKTVNLKRAGLPDQPRIALVCPRCGKGEVLSPERLAHIQQALGIQGDPV